MSKKADKTPKQKKKKKGTGKVKATFLGIFAAIVLTCCVVLSYIMFNFVSTVNGDIIIDIDHYKKNQNQTSFIYAKDKEGKFVEVARLHGDEDRVWVDLDDISPYMAKAFIALEDKRFSEHHGVDWVRVGGVIVKPQQIGQGGSTITQQLIKNFTNNKEVTVVRKVNEMLYALNLERHYDKNTIIEAYMNTVYLGNGCNGVKTASEKYFGKDVKNLNAAECAVIASITQFPTKFNPLLHPENNKNRQEYCLKMMNECGFLSEAEYKDAVNYHLVFTNSDDYVESEDDNVRKTLEEETKINSFYIDAVIDSFVNQMMETYDYSKQQATDELYYGGYKIYSAVDLEIQSVLENVYVNRINFPKISKADGTLPQSSMTIMDYTGRVVAIVGQAGEKTSNRVLNRATSSYRQPGSTIKPIATYAPAIDLGQINYSSRVLDYAVYVDGELWPHNVDKSLGSNSKVGMEYAIQQSLNTVPTRIIKDIIGMDSSLEYLRDHFHLSKLDDVNDRALSPLATGSLTYGTNTLEMAAAYETFGNGGKYYKPYFYYYVTQGDSEERIFDNENQEPLQAISEETAEIVRRLLQTVDTSYYATAPNVRRFQLMAKTGTTPSDCDRWFCAGTPYYVASVWLGYDIKEPLNQDVNPCGKIFFTVFDEIHKDLPDKEFEESDKVVEKRYCTSSGKLAGSNCGSTKVGYYDADNLPETCSSCQNIKKDEDETKSPAEEYSEMVSEAVEILGER